VQQVLDRVVTMRATEGRALRADLQVHCRAIQQALEIVQSRAPTALVEYRDRLGARVTELIANASIRLAEQDLLKEVSVYAERSDLSEEISRLIAHAAQFDSLMDGGSRRGASWSSSRRRCCARRIRWGRRPATGRLPARSSRSRARSIASKNRSPTWNSSRHPTLC
jgi:hypothetical protein